MYYRDARRHSGLGEVVPLLVPLLGKKRKGGMGTVDPGDTLYMRYRWYGDLQRGLSYVIKEIDVWNV